MAFIGEFSGYSAEDLAYALHQLIVRKKTSPSEVRALVAGRAERIAALERELAELRGDAVPARGTRVRGRVPGRGRSFTVTAKVREARRQQGRYLGRLRKRGAADRARHAGGERDEAGSDPGGGGDPEVGRPGRVHTQSTMVPERLREGHPFFARESPAVSRPRTCAGPRP